MRQFFLLLGCTLFTCAVWGQEFYALDSVAQIEALGIQELVVTAGADSGAVEDTVFIQRFDKQGRCIALSSMEDDPTWECTSYDKNGNQTTLIELSHYGDTLFVTDFSYEGNLLVAKESYTPDRRMVKKEVYTYDQNKRPLSKKFFKTDGTPYLEFRYRYDDKKRTRTMEQFDQLLGLVSQSTTYTYNAQEKVTKEVRKGLEGESSAKFYRYDDLGHLINLDRKVAGKTRWSLQRVYEKDKLLSETRKEAGDMVWQTNYAYGKDGRVAKRVKAFANGDESSFAQTYHTNGNLMHKTFYHKEGDRTFMQEINYDEAGRVLSENQTSAGEIEWSLRFSYNEHGLCTQKVETVKGNGTRWYTYHYQ